MAAKLPSTPRFFPDPDTAGAHGLVSIDSRLDEPRLLDAYRHGIFPWPSRIDEGFSIGSAGTGWQIGWYSPDPRAVLPLNALHVSERLDRKLRLGQFRFTWNCNFQLVLEQCATLGRRRIKRWLSPRLMTALEDLHRSGHARSIEVYHVEEGFRTICGGLYGISIGGAFAAESMFHLRSDASKAAVVALLQLMSSSGQTLLDIQLPSKHMQDMGAIEIPRSQFLRELSEMRFPERSWRQVSAAPLTLMEIAMGERKS